MNPLIDAMTRVLYKHVDVEGDAASAALKDSNMPAWQVHMISAKLALMMAEALIAAGRVSK